MTFGDYLYSYALRRVRRAEVAEDLVQETLLAALRSGSSFEGDSSLRTWLTGILRHKINDHFRAAYRQAGVASFDRESVGDAAGADAFDRRGKWRVPVAAWRADPARMADDRELRAAIDACVGKLPTTMAALFLGRAVDDVETVQLCAELGIEVGNAWTLLHRARLRLRQCLAATWFAEPARQPQNSRTP